jgi:hypothetical protein
LAPIPNELRRRINQFTHAEGQKLERELRDRLTGDLQKRAANGARGAELSVYLDAQQIP